MLRYYKPVRRNATKIPILHLITRQNQRVMVKTDLRRINFLDYAVPVGVFLRNLIKLSKSTDRHQRVLLAA